MGSERQAGGPALLEDGACILAAGMPDFPTAARIGGWAVVAATLATPGAVPVAAGTARSGAELAAAAVEAMGGAAAIATLGALEVTADCTGPNGPYVSQVAWRRDGRTVLRQSHRDGRRTMLAVGDEAWELDGKGRVKEPLAKGTAAMVHGHAFHPTLFGLDRRFHDHRAAGVGEGGCLRLGMLDDGDRPASACLDPETMLPARVSFTPAAGGGAIELVLSDWRRRGALLYFTELELRQGDEEYRWVYSSIEPVASAPASPASPGPGPTGRTWRPGERISLSLKDADLAEVLRSFARLAGFNLVLDPSVRGSVTVELRDVPWEQALEVILRTHGLAVDGDGATWRVR